MNQGQVVSRRDFLLISQNIFQIFVYYSAYPEKHGTPAAVIRSRGI
jgi:hypothetical protein